MYKILIVEDDTIINRVLYNHLIKWGFSVHSASEFSNITQTFEEYKPHLILLDITLPFFNGYYWCEEVRKISQVPIVFISSACEDMNLVMAISIGADDFIAKPFNLDVVTAKLQALLRRTYAFGADLNMVQFGDISMNLSDYKVCYGQLSADVTKNEAKILQLLMEAKGAIVSREEIMRRLWEDESFIDDNTLTVNIARLRKKLASLGLCDYVSTKKGIGYFLNEICVNSCEAK